MTDTRLTVLEVAAVAGADLLDDAELARRLAYLAWRAAMERADAQDLWELAATALVTARRLEARS